MLEPNDAPYTQQQDEAASGSDELDLDGDHRPSEDRPKVEGFSITSKSYCYLCGKGVIKFYRHLLRHIHEDPEIAEILALPKTSKDRRRLVDELRNRGNYQHNQEVLKNNSGELKLRRRLKNMAISVETHLHCLHCKGMYARKMMRRHLTICPSRTMSNPSTGGKTRVFGEIAFAESPYIQTLPRGVRKMLLTMKQDEIAYAVQNDFLLIELAKKYGNNPRKHEQIGQMLREMGRLLLALNEKSISDFKDAIKPQNFHKVVEAVKKLTGFNEEMQSYDKPSLASRLGHSLTKMCTVVFTGVDGDDRMSADTKTFMELCEKEWFYLVSHAALASSSGRKVSNPSTIPFTRDVQVFYKYLEKTFASAIENLQKYESPQAYKALCRVTLAQASVLSKCIPEVSKMTVKTFQERDNSTQVLSKHFIKINIQSRTGQNVAVLLTSDLVNAITLLVDKRQACGVHEKNPFLFAMPNSSPTSLFHGANCIRAFLRLCRAKNPVHFRSVHLHKHIARVFQILNLENDELDHLAKLLGRDIRVDRDYFRLPEAAGELAKISKLLLAMERGSLEKFKGNSLEEIEIEDELEPDVEQGNPGNCDAEEDAEESDVSPQQSEAAEQQDRQLTPEQDALDHIKACTDKPFLEERFIDPFKGRGVFTRESIQPSTFVVEYRGIIFSPKETRKKCGDTLNHYMFDFSWIGTNWRIDAANEDGTLGRLVNDDHTSPNCEMKKIVSEGIPHLCLFAVTEISPGEEITYSYGELSYPWRSTESSEDISQAHVQFPPDEESGDDEHCIPHTSANDHQSFEEPSTFGASCIQQEDESDYSPDDDFTPDEEAKVPTTTNKNYCYVCGIAQSKISRHLFTHKKEEPAIAAVLKLRKNSKERKALLKKLRDRGNIKHNDEVLKTCCGELKVGRIFPKKPSAAKKFAPCLYCKSMYPRENMWRHMQTCSGKKLSDPLLGCKSKVSTLIAVAESETQNPSPDVRQLLDTLKKDERTSEIWSDSLLLAMAQCSYTGNGRNAEDIKLRLRQLGRLLLSLKERSISSFEDAVKPQNSSKLVEAVRELTCFNEDTNSYERPSLIKKLRSSLKTIADINFARAWKEGAGSERIQEAEAFMKLCAKEWGYVKRAKSKVDNQPTVPFVHDVQNFLHCMEKSAASALLSLTLYESSPVYNALLRVTVAQLMVLNKNMGEASKATLKSFKERDEAELHEDAAASRSPLEQILSQHTVKINVTTDEGQQVAVELTRTLLTAITLLVDKRGACGVHENNPFLFGLSDASCTSIHHRQRCVSFFLGRCGVKNAAVIRLPSFHKHIKRVFQILNLTDDELVELSKVLGRDIQTDRGYYQTPEAAADISELLSAIEKESLERLKRKSLEEIEIPEEELEEDVEPDDPEDSEAEEESESSFLNSPDFAKSSFSRRRRRVRRTRQESENEGSEPHDETNEEVNSEKDVGSKERAESCALNTPEETASPSNEDAANMPFSDGDEDMNVDFDMDTEEDNDDEEGDTNGSTATPLVPDVRKRDSDGSDTEMDNISAHKRPGVSDPEETVDTDTGNKVEEGGGEKKNILSAAMIGMKGVKILIPKLDIEKFRAPVHISQLSSELKDQPIQDIKNQRRTSSPITNTRDDSSSAKMSCSHCLKSMMKGQTAFQKKGFTEVFCSKNCLFELFPSNAPVYKTCHVCLKAITQPLDLIMAAVDMKGTMKNFCSTTCLISFKSNTVSPQTPQQLCSMCNKSCTMTCQLIVNRAVHAFCSDSCLEDFRRDNVVNCENCSSACHKETLRLKLEEGTKNMCSQNCLEEFRETMEALHHCTMCHTSLPVSDMVGSKTEENVVELFCNRACVTSYKLRPANAWELQAKEFLDQTNKLQRIHVLSAEDDGTDSTVNNIDPPAESDSMPTLTVAKTPVTCSSCRKWLMAGKTLFQAKKNSLVVFCSFECLNKNLQIRSVTKKCYNCLQMIMPPHKLILAPVDESGTMKELCGNTCLASVNSKRSMAAPKPPARAAGPRAECKMCARYCHYKHERTQDHIRLCSDACLMNYHQITNVPLFTCEVCSSFFLQKWLQLSPEDGSKTICSDECLVKFKEKVKTPRLCPMCQTPHQLSDMVEHKTDDRLDFFCSSRCMTLHKASTVSGRNSPSSEDGNAKEVKWSLQENDVKEVKVSPEEEDIKEVKVSPEEEDIKEVKVSPEEEDIKEVKVSPEEEDIKEVKVSPEEEDIKEVKVSPEEDIKEVKPPLPNLHYIKEEPIDEEYNHNVPSSIYTEDIKDEPKAGDDVVKEGLKIGSVFSLTGGSASKTPSVPHMDLSASCSNCKRVLMDGETVSRRKGHADVFCSTPCLLKFYQMKKTCHFCLQGITQPQDLVQAPVDVEQTMKDFCSKTCLSSFNFKRFTSTKIPLKPIASQSQCSVCSQNFISKHEVIQQDVVHKICSDPCLLRFCNVNHLSVCENCRCSCDTPLVLRMDDGSKTLCSAECLAQFKRKTQRLQPCAMCRSAHVMSDMFENKNVEDAVELFCTSSCVMASKIQAVRASGTPLDCDHCGKNTLPACHLAMSDFSITSFCTLTCAMAFKETQKDRNAATNSTGAADQTQCDFLKPPEKLPCAQCRQSIETTPKVIQEKGKVHFVCSLACSQEFKTVNNIFGQCEYCKNERIIGDVEKVDGKDCYFCNDGCKMLFRHELVTLWGKHCGLCAYCFSISKTLVTAKYGGADEEFCSEGCSSKYNKLLCQVAKCDTCGRDGKLRQSLPMLGEVKHFCDLRCLRHFCNKNVQLVNTVSSAPGSSGTVDSSPVIANVISLASVLARHTASASSTQHGEPTHAHAHTGELIHLSVPDIQPKVVGHASVQTVPRELKNKSMLCTPLVHNKGVSCTTRTVDAETQTDNFVPQVLPVPVPMYVPLPMNMYSQYTPTPVALPLPIPVPVFLPDSTVRSVKERIQPDLLEGDESERKNVQDERREREDRVVTEEGQRVHSPKGKTFDEYEVRTSTRIVDLDSDHQTNNQEDSTSDTSVGSLRHKKTLLVLETGLSCEPTRELPPPAAPLKMSSPDPEPAPQTVGKVHNKNKGRKRQRSSNAAEEETSKRQKITSRTHRKLKSQCGTDAWKRWIQWRNSQTNLDLLSPHAVKLKEDVLCCSATELSDGLCLFITEAKQPDGEPHSPDSLFYLCLSIQQYLFDNGRMENIFTDLIYSKFSTKFINILRTFKPSISASGYIHSRVEEGFLWDCKQLGAYSPIVLLNTLLFFCCKYFGFTTVEQHCRLSFAHVMSYTKTNQNNTKTTFLCFYPPKSISEAESGTDGGPAKKRWKDANKRHILKMMENTENPLRCPVRLFQFYLSKCSESVRQRTDSFYLHPDGRCVPSSPLWFSSSPLDRGCMEAMLVRSLAVRQQRGKDER